MPIEGIVFDKDGTLYDFDATWGAWAKVMMAKETEDDPVNMARLADALGYDLVLNQFKPGSVVIAETVDVLADKILSVLPHLVKVELIARMNTAAARVPQIEAVPLRGLLTRLKDDGYTLGIATNDAEEPARAHLEKSGITSLFDFIAGFDSGYGGKPAPGQLQGFCRAMELKPLNCAMVGDSTHDLQAGRAAGMHTVGVLTGPAPREELAPFADAVLPSIADLPAWLGRV